MSMLEKVARAIEPDWFGEVDGRHILDNYPDQHKDYQRCAFEKAGRVIEALMEPDEAMIKAFNNAVDEGFKKHGHLPPAQCVRESTKEAWPAMLKAALDGDEERTGT